ncbi:MAG: cupredoxin domain-containing protein [Candidatus Colwellbacteria bacterium]|nr:cupredoxin domain-containing protein [Candidatus Colwellbacteria bacterium]
MKIMEKISGLPIKTIIIYVALAIIFIIGGAILWKGVINTNPDNSPITTPGVGDAAQNPDVVIPSVVAPAAPGSTSKRREFNIEVANGVFTPSTVVVNIGDTVHINLTSIDREYDLTIPSLGIKQTVARGQTKPLEFQVNEVGSWPYYCDLCGGAESSTKGILVVNK